MSDPHRLSKTNGASYIRPASSIPDASFESYQALDGPLPLGPSDRNTPHDRGYPTHSAPNRPANSVLASLIPSRPAYSSAPSRPDQKSMSYAAYIKSATPGAFSSPAGPSKFRPPTGIAGPSSGNIIGQQSQSSGRDAQGGEVFDLDAANITAADTMYFDRDAEKHMRELLSGAIGEGEDDGDEAMDTVHGLAEGVTLMPHQQRGVRWLKKREAAKNYGGILADVSGSLDRAKVYAHITGYGSGEDCADDSAYLREEGQSG